jgi:hypothetical protein
MKIIKMWQWRVSQFDLILELKMITVGRVGWSKYNQSYCMP